MFDEVICLKTSSAIFVHFVGTSCVRLGETMWNSHKTIQFCTHLTNWRNVSVCWLEAAGTHTHTHTCTWDIYQNNQMRKSFQNTRQRLAESDSMFRADIRMCCFKMSAWNSVENKISTKSNHPLKGACCSLKIIATDSTAHIQNGAQQCYEVR